jgi:N-acetylglucosamine kinase-like BadF-type ATPase
MLKLALGIDGGGTSTTCAALDAATGQELGRGVAISSNSNSVGFEAAFDAVMTAMGCALRGALNGAGAPEVEVGAEVGAIVLACAGVDRDADKGRWRNALAKRYISPLILVDNDAIGALASGTGGDVKSGCMVLIAGTGTIAVGVARDGHRVRAAGWGPTFDDRGRVVTPGGCQLGCMTI